MISPASRQAAMGRICLLLLAAALFVWYSAYRYADRPDFQASGFIALAILFILRCSLREFRDHLILFFGFAMTMLLVYLVFGLLKIQDRTLTYWLHIGAGRVLLFLNTMLAFGFLLSFLGLEDILSLPLPPERLKYLILGEILYRAAIRVMPRMRFYVSLFPEFQTGKRGVRREFRAQLITVLGLICFVLREAEIRGEMLDNRLRHCGRDGASHAPPWTPGAKTGTEKDTKIMTAAEAAK